MSTLTDPIPGNIGLELDDDTVVLLRFDEPDGVPPSDAAATLEDLTAAASGNIPTVDDEVAWEGATSRKFTGRGFVADDQSGADGLLTRDVSVQALLAFETPTGTPTYSLICRGTNASAAQYVSYGVTITVVSGSEWTVNMIWADGGGTIETVLVSIDPITAEEFVLLTVTRRVESASSVVVRVYVNDELAGEDTSTEGVVGGGTTGTTAIGCRYSGGAYTQFLDGWIDSLKVVSREMSHEEVRATWRRLSVYQPEGVAMVRGLMPPGAPWLRAGPDSDIGRFIKAAGQAVGYAKAKAHELRAMHLPSHAYRDHIASWERLVGLPSYDRTPLDTRRQLVVSRLERENGYSVPKVQDVLSTPMDLDADDVEIVEFASTVSDAFATLEVERWEEEPAAAWAVSSNQLVLTRTTGDDIRFNPAAALSPCRLRTPIDDDEGLVAQVMITSFWTSFPVSTIAGLTFLNWMTGDTFWYGIYNDAGTRKIAWQQLKDATLSSATVTLATTSNAAYYLRVRQTAAGTYVVSHSTTGFDSASAVETTVTGVFQGATYVGLGAMSTATTIAGDLSATFDAFTYRAPASKRPYHWYAYRDTGLSGDPSMIEAMRLARQVRPAHTYAAAITSLSLLCDDDESACDAGPMGGL